MTDRVETASPDELLGLSSDALSAMLRLRQAHPELSDELQPAIMRIAELSGRLTNLSFEQVLIRITEGWPTRTNIPMSLGRQQHGKFATLERPELAGDADFGPVLADLRESNNQTVSIAEICRRIRKLVSLGQYNTFIRYYGLGGIPPMSLAEIAAEAGTSPSAARSILHSAMLNVGLWSASRILKGRGPHFKFR